MPNPRLLVCDTDALIQLFLTKDSTRKLIPLRVLRDFYEIQPVIVEEVEIEIRSSKTFLNQFEADLKKSLTSGTISLLDASAFLKYVPSPHARSVFASYQGLGRQYYRYVDRGEAYTLAAAVTLNEPAMSNDFSALEVLDKQGFALPTPVLRAFDLFTLCYQTGDLVEKECDSARQDLIRFDEGVPRSFRHASFRDGLESFCPRLLDDAKPTIGLAPTPTAAHKSQRLIKRK
jgi:hypothetical protein